MPIYSPTGFLDVTNATLRGSKIVTTSNVGVANLNPLNTLSVGSNLQVEDTGSNVLVIHGNAAMAAVTLGAVHVAPVYDLEVVTNLGNTTSNTVQFTNDTTGFVSVSNIEIGTGNLVVDTSTGTVTVGNKLDVTDAHASNLTVASALYANAETGRVGVHTTNPGNFALDVHGSANVGALTANSLIVTGDLAVAGEVTSIRSTTVTVDDPIIGLANNNTGGVLDTGFVIQRDVANVAIIFDESDDTLRIGYTQSKHTDTTITMDESIPFHMNVHGNVSVSNLEIGQFSVVAAYGLDHVTNENNSTGDTIISTNGTTGLQTTANVNVGRDALVSGNVVVSQDLTVAGTSAISGDLTVDTSTFHVDSSTNRVGILTTSPGYDLDVHGSANVGTLTVGSVSSNLEVGTANLFVDTVTGYVGVGTTSPGASLEVSGNVAVSSNLEVTGNVGVSQDLTVTGNIYGPMTTFRAYSFKTSYSTSWTSAEGLAETEKTILTQNVTVPDTYTSVSPCTMRVFYMWKWVGEPDRFDDVNTTNNGAQEPGWRTSVTHNATTYDMNTGNFGATSSGFYVVSSSAIGYHLDEASTMDLAMVEGNFEINGVSAGDTLAIDLNVVATNDFWGTIYTNRTATDSDNDARERGTTSLVVWLEPIL